MRVLKIAVAGLLLATFAVGGVAEAATPPPAPDTSTFCQNVPAENPFTDVGPGAHHDTILCLAYAGITQGNTPTTYNPSAVVRRDQMATFVARAIDEMNRLAKPGHEMQQLPLDEDDDDFWDDVAPGSTHHQNIGRLYEAGIVNGTGDRTYNPSGAVTRAQMATFINRSEQYLTGSPFSTSNDYFTDDDGNVHEDNINGIASVGIAQGTSTGNYGPDNPVTREQMASFLIRWFAVHEGAGDITPLPPDIGPDVVGLEGLDADQSFTFSEGDSITLTFAAPVAATSSITLIDGFGTSVTLTDQSPTPANATNATFVVTDDGKSVIITPKEPVVYNGGASNFSEAVTITDSSGITDVASSDAWNPDREPIDQVRVDLF